MPQDIQQPIVKNWLNNKLATLYNDPIYKQGNSDVQAAYKRKAYDKWVVPFFKKTGKDNPWKTPDEFINPTTLTKRLYTEQQKDIKSKQGEKQQAAMVGATDKAIAGISSFLNTIGTTTENLWFHGQPTENKIPALKESEQYYDKQAQIMEERVQGLGGHDIRTRASQVIAESALFEATGAAKGAKLFQLANPRTADYATRLLKAGWNGAVTGLFWGTSTGTKPQDLHEDASTFALLGMTGASGTALYKFLRTFTRSAPPETIQAVITEAATKLTSKEGVLVPREKSFDINKPLDNRTAATAGIAQTLNTMAAQVSGSQEINGAFQQLTPKQQKLVLTRLFGALSQFHNEETFNLMKQLEPLRLQEQEQNARQVAPVVQQVQESIDKFIKERVPDVATKPEELSRMKTGAVLPHHVTNENSPIQHISARMSWLRSQLKRTDLSGADRDIFQTSLNEEKELYKKVKTAKEAVKKDLLVDKLKKSVNAVGDTEAFQQAKRELPNGSFSDWARRAQEIKTSMAHGSGGVSVEEIQRPGKHYVISKYGQVTYHGKQFDPGSTSRGATHVTVLSNGKIQVNEGPALDAYQRKKLEEALK